MVHGQLAYLTGTVTIDEKNSRMTGLKLFILVKSVGTG